MKPLTRRQAEVLAVIQMLIDDRGYAPVTRELGRALGLRSLSSTHYHLAALRRKGYVVWEPHKPRTLRVVKTA